MPGSQRIATGSFNEQRRFVGEEYDGDTEFSYLNARYYQSSRGQFMSQNPVFVNLGADKRTSQILRDPQLMNAYSYSRNNPLVLVDNRELIFGDNYSDSQRDHARFLFGFDVLTTVTGAGLGHELGKAFLALSSDILSGLEKLGKPSDEKIKGRINLTHKRM